MPPPLPQESDAESVTGDAKKDDPSDTVMKDDEGEEEDADDDDEEEVYVVEAIHDHRGDFEDGQMRYQVKWKGWEKKSDRTWETEENLDGARELLEAYWTKIGGKPEPGEPKPSASKKRGRQSTGGDSARGTPKVPKHSKKGTARKSNGAMDQDIEPGALVGFTEVGVGADDWKPPLAKDGSWDPLVQSIDTVVRENTDGELWGYIIWNEKNEDGRFYRSRAKLPVIYKACPQRMLHFYEKHLVFSSGGDENATEAKTES